MARKKLTREKNAIVTRTTTTSVPSVLSITRMTSMVCVVCMLLGVFASFGLAGCTQNGEDNLDSPSLTGSVSSSDVGEPTADMSATGGVTAQATDTASASGTAQMETAPGMTYVPAPTPNPTAKSSDKKPDLFCGIYLTFSRLKKSVYNAKFKGNTGENDIAFEFPIGEGIALFTACQPQPELSISYILQADGAFDAKRIAKGKRVNVTANAFIRKGTAVYRNTVYQRADGSVYLLPAAVSAPVKKVEVLKRATNTMIYGENPANSIVKIKLRVKFATYDRLAFKQLDADGKEIDLVRVSEYSYPECVVLEKATKTLEICQYKRITDADGGVSFKKTKVERIRRKDIPQFYKTHFMGGMMYAAGRILEIIK